MGKMIAVWGTPNSGKTAFSMKLAEALYASEKHRKLMIMVVLTDVVTPSIPVIFPNYRSDDVYSIGGLLAKTTLTADDVFSYTTFLRGRENLGVLGYKDSENSHSHPDYTQAKAETMFNILRASTDYVIVDCMCDPDGSVLTETALLGADQTIWLATPDLKAMSYTLSHKNIFTSRGLMRPTQVACINVPVQEFAMPIADAKAHLGKIQYTIPFSLALAEQSVEGSMGEELHDRKYMQSVRMIMEKVR